MHDGTFFLDITLFLNLVSHQKFLMPLLGIFYIHLHPPYCVKSVHIWELFWCVFSGIRTEYGEVLLISPYFVRMWENTDQNTDTFYVVPYAILLKGYYKRQVHYDGLTKVLPKQLFAFSLFFFFFF